MDNLARVIGYVVDKFDDRDATFLVVKTGGGTGKSGRAWEELVACRFYGDARKFASMDRGALIKVDGKTTSRKGEKGYFTSFEARYATELLAAPLTGAAADSNIPF